MIIQTVKVKNADLESGFMIINESDFDKAVHELFDAPAAHRELEEYSRQELFAVAKAYNVEVRQTMKNSEIASTIRTAAGYDASKFPPAEDK